jgi:hypothetical protein
MRSQKYRDSKLSLLALVVLLGAVSCGGATLVDLVARAKFDLQCPEADLQFTTIDDHTHGVSGCGKQATYLRVCATTGWGEMNCRWTLDAATKAATSAPAAPPQASATKP